MKQLISKYARGVGMFGIVPNYVWYLVRTKKLRDENYNVLWFSIPIGTKEAEISVIAVLNVEKGNCVKIREHVTTKLT